MTSLPYSVSNGKRIYWVSGARNASLANTIGSKHTNESLSLIQDFMFPSICHCVRISPDGNFVVATGGYKPQMRVFSLSNLSMHFERHLDGDALDMEFMDTDWTRVCLLTGARTLSLHNEGGLVCDLRLPSTTRAILRRPGTADLLGATRDGVDRISLDEGRFRDRLSVKCGVESVAAADVHTLVAAGCTDGSVALFDMRVEKEVASMSVFGERMSAVAFSPDGARLSAGGCGRVVTFDLRSADPLHVCDHRSDSAIGKIEYMDERRFLSADERTVRIIDGDIFVTGIEAPTHSATEAATTINDVTHVRRTGMILVAPSDRSVLAHFIPEVGQAPGWCAFLDNMADERQPGREAVSTFRFLTRERLERLGLEKLIGTKYLRAYMHGWFADARLVEKAEAAMAPFDYQAYLRNREVQHIESKRQPRVRIEKAEEAGESAGVDSRFAAIFEDSDFRIEEGHSLSVGRTGPKNKTR